MSADTKPTMIAAAAELLRTRGLTAMSFSDVLAQSGASRGVIYHHFPGGKTELARDAVAFTGAAVRDHLAALPGTTAMEVVEAFLDAIRPVVAESAHGAGCAVAAVTVESTGQGALAEAARDAFASWTATTAERLRAAGASPDPASTLAALLVAVLEGSHVLCRAAGSLRPFEQSALGVRAAARELL